MSEQASLPPATMPLPIVPRPAAPRRFGLDAAVSVTILLRGFTSFSGLATLWLIALTLDRGEQGYYYTFGSLLAVQVFAELGINFVVMQFASHEMVELSYAADGTLQGNARALGRLSALLRFALLWFATLSALFVAVVIPAGVWFLSRDRSATAPHWHVAWILSVVFTALLLLVAPFMSLLEGCGRVAQMAQARLLQAVAGSVILWLAFLAHAGLLALPLSLAATALGGIGWLWWHERAVLRSLLGTRPTDGPRALLRELLPMQWRIALSWLSGYFVSQLFTPVLFSTRGAVEAGQMGMSVSLAGGVSAVALVWITTKSPMFGTFVAQRALPRLDDLFERSLRQAMIVGIAVAAGLGLVLALGTHLRPALASRLISPGAMVALVLASLASVILTAEAVYLRAFKREPFLPVSLAVGGATSASTLLLAPRYGAAGVAIGYCVVNWIIGVGIGTWLFRRLRTKARVEFAT